ncbi:MAG: type II/IV secretion system protein [Burkholderiales bacterium]|nr:type II/IV secretion system protein [Burkholderiales bacterium]
MNAPVDQRLFAAERLEHARRSAASRGVRLLEALEDDSGLPPGEFTAALAARFGLPAADMAMLHALEPVFDLLPFAEALQRECLLLRNASQALVLVFADPFSETLRPWAEERIRQSFGWALAHRADIAAYLARHEESLRAMDSMGGATGESGTKTDASEDLSLRSITTDTSPVVKLVHSALYDALKLGASDIHLETGPAGLSIKYRLDGVLGMAHTLAGQELAEQVISRVKVMAELDIAERRIPQDGRFRVSNRGREIDIRVSIMPSIFGEDAVMRVLDKQALADEVRGLRLDLLGFDAPTVMQLRRLSKEPHGMLLVTGPTGSGKTTTLYAAITEINHGRDKIITIEDPVEYQLPGVLQIPVNEKKGLTFARGLRSILRHDPDKIMVGEIRDPETAQIAVQAALTGHLVFTTVHANNVFDVIGRFVHMQVDTHSFVSALNAILAQRLLRLNCVHCSVDAPPEAELLEESALAAERVAGYRFRAGRGCGQCRGTGYRGRRAVAELLIMKDDLRELIAERAPLTQIKAAAARHGVTLLREAALALVARGETTLAEANRVTMVA